MSRGSRSKLTLVTTFALAMGAGLVMGIAAARRGAAAQTSPAAQQPQSAGRSKTAVELNLTSQQEEQVKSIWAAMTQGPFKTINEKRRELQKERDDTINRLFTSEQKAEYDHIQAEYSTKSAELGKERQRQVDAAVEQVKRLLNETQRQKYEQILKDRGGHGRRPFGGGGGQGRESRNAATTHPAGAGTAPDGSTNSARPSGSGSSPNKSPAPATRPVGDPS